MIVPPSLRIAPPEVLSIVAEISLIVPYVELYTEYPLPELEFVMVQEITLIPPSL